MKRFPRSALLFFVFATALVRAQTTAPKPPPTPPNEIVDQLWTMATTGELLTAKGRAVASGLFLQASPVPAGKSFAVVSNFWSPAYVMKTNGNVTDVVVEYWPAGSIDSELRYSPPSPSIAVKFFMLYHLTLAPTYHTEQTFETSGSVRQKNGYVAPTWKVTGTKTVEGPPAWRIEGSAQQPFATVNAAIRYVLEMRDITKDPVIKQNGDKTLRILLHLDDLYRKHPPSACACD